MAFGPQATTPTKIKKLSPTEIVIFWSDGHETLFLVEELRDLCGCAACKGEPNYPITGQ